MRDIANGGARVRNVGPFDRESFRGEVRAARRWPKPDFVRSSLNQAELHAYYIAILSSRGLALTRKGLRGLA